MQNKNTVSEWFSQRRLGLFLHFGLYSIEGWHEQDQMRRRIPHDVYRQLINRFNPVNFNPKAILDLAESAGMEYVCLTTKHHDGFCLWETKQTTFNVMNSPYKKDLVKQLADECHRRNFPLGLYYSVADWNQPNYPNQGRHHELPAPKPGDEPDWNKYIDFLKKQVRELCTNYGKIHHFFWDINVPKHQAPSINNMLRELQPNIVINDRGFDKGDFGTPEREYNRNETEAQSCFERPTEACNSVGTQSWGYRVDEDYYSSAFLIKSIDEIMCKGGHYLLNVGPDGQGNIPDQAKKILAEVGSWYLSVKEAFSDTIPASELTSNQDIMLTRRENTLYVHIPMPAKAEAVIIPPISQKPISAVLLNTDHKLETSTDILPSFWESNRHILNIKGIPRNLLSTGETLIIRLDFDSPAAFYESPKVNQFQG